MPFQTKRGLPHFCPHAVAGQSWYMPAKSPSRICSGAAGINQCCSLALSQGIQHAEGDWPAMLVCHQRWRMRQSTTWLACS